MMLTDREIVNILKLAMDTITDAASVEGGAPSGIVYAALSAHGMRLSTYQQILAAMESAGKIKISNHVITLA